eukprot:TRINITY_DN72215_c0_g1_i1.p1 TRINITY_DN72215_c0_g1~~TRINITY_DN72215_c0_g1_i1.p1  ORF type:complete len:445 (+),score=120.45 TRINITY_DN72215_c0_g1_i1:32-1336(+)
MSFRELRNFCEMMRSLGYPRIISMENFRTPNFELVADLLDWLLHRFEPGCSVPDDISTESHRVKFVKDVCEKVVLKTSVKLNPKKVYGADGYAVKEILKLAQILYDAQKTISEAPPELGEDFTLSSKLADLKSTRSLCSQIVESGASLFELLQKEMDVRADREKALRFLDGMSRNLGSNSESEVVERAVSQLLGSHSQNLEQMKQMTEELQRDEKGLEQKIKKKKQELDRCTKRLSSLATVRPAFMDEYEQLEQELERYYEQYVGRFRNLDYLEHEIDVLNREETEKMEENERALKRMQKRLRDEEWRLLRGEEDDKGKDRKQKKMHGAKRWMPPSASGVDNVDGSMEGGEDDASSDGSGSDSDPPISVGGSEDSDGLAIGGGNRGGSPREGSGFAGGGNSVSEDDILNESDDDISDDDIGGGGPHRGGTDFDF